MADPQIPEGIWRVLWSWLDAAIPAILVFGVRVHIIQEKHEDAIRSLTAAQRNCDEQSGARDSLYARRDDVTRLEAKIDRVLELLATGHIRHP